MNVVQLEVDGRVGIIKINRPDAMNAIDDDVINGIYDAVEQFEKNDAIHCMILTGIDRVFAAGADIDLMMSYSYMDAYKKDFITSNWERIKRARKPIIAAVSGYALGGGCELAMMCDMIFASESAKFGQPEIKLGALPGAGGTQRLPRAVGKAKAMDLCLSGRMMDVEEAERSGLVARIFPNDQLMTETIKAAKEIAAYSLPALMMAKESVNRAFESSLNEGLLFERRTFQAAFALKDQKEGMKAFVEKRDPNFINE